MESWSLTPPQESRARNFLTMKTEYLILESNSAHDLNKLVCDAIDQGWEPQGGVAVSLPHYMAADIVIYQAMVREMP